MSLNGIAVKSSVTDCLLLHGCLRPALWFAPTLARLVETRSAGYCTVLTNVTFALDFWINGEMVIQEFPKQYNIVNTLLGRSVALF